MAGVQQQWAVGSCTSGTALVGSVSSFSHIKSNVGEYIPEERFSGELGIDLSTLKV